MINIKDKTKCCGCGACEQICTHDCISMVQDSEGFFYPQVDKNKCVDCGLCNKVCQYETSFIKKEEPLSTYAYVSENQEMRKNSSSGAFFMLAAKRVLEYGGIVWASRFDDSWNVVVDSAEKEDDLKRFAGSKYVQSLTGHAYSDIRSVLQQGRWALFCGTPCQVSGLNHYLQKKYENLITIDFACHAVPSPGVWQEYLHYLSKDQYTIKYVNFRNKEIAGWHNYGLQIDAVDKDNNPINLVSEGNKQNRYMQGFLKYVYCRPSCSNCAAKGFNTGSDVMIGDFWHVEEYHKEEILNDNKGVSLVMNLTEKGQTFTKTILQKGFSLQVDNKEIELDKVHSCIVKSESPHHLRKVFFVLKKIDLFFSIWFCVSLYQYFVNLINKVRYR